MSKWACFLILLLVHVNVWADKPESIKICTPEWEYYTQQDGSGLYHDLWKAIFAESGLTVEVHYAPYKRCEQDVQVHQAHDVFPGGYANTTKATTMVPKWHIGVDLLTVAYKKGTLDAWQGQDSLEGKRVSWERGYAFDQYGIVTANVDLNEFTKLEYAMRMLISERIDFLIDYEQAMTAMVEEMKLQDQVVVLPNVIKGPKYYMEFIDTERGRALAKIWDEGMARLHSTGELQKLYAEYEDQAH